MAGFSPMPEHEFGAQGHALAPAVHEIAEEKRSKRNPRQLDFEAAMNDFRSMFPGLEVELIESVLRANNGAVDDTIDALLTMNFEEKTTQDHASSAHPSPPLLPPKPVGSLRSSTERLQMAGDPSPALPPREGSLKRNNHKPKHTPQILHNTPQTTYNTEWNGRLIPMLGKLPSNFLRIVQTDSPPPRPPKTINSKQRSQSMRNKIPTHLAEQPVTKSRTPVTFSQRMPARSHTVKARHTHHTHHITSSGGERLSSNALKRQIEANQRRLQETCENNDLDGDTERFLEDERLALIMQNEEFLRELKRNEDFMRTLEFERDMLANRLLHEQKKNRQLSQLSPSSERAPPNWMVPRASEFDENSLPRSLSPTSEFSSIRRARSDDGNTCLYGEALNPDIVPVDRTDEHDFRDQLKSMGATSKKKFALLAKKFFSTSRKKRKGGKILRDAHGPSTLNLLDDNDDEELIDASASLHSGGTDEVLFEPLPNCWTGDRPDDGAAAAVIRSDTRFDENEHFL